MKVLVVDDDEMARVAYKRAYSEHYTLVTANSLGEARRKLGERTIDLAVIDLVLPDGSGMDLLKELAQNYPHVRRALLSGFLDHHVSVSATTLAHVIAAKPISLLTVIRALESAAERPITLGSSRSELEHVPESLDEVIRRTIERAVARNDGNVSKAAEELKIGRTTIYRTLNRSPR